MFSYTSKHALTPFNRWMYKRHSRNNWHLCKLCDHRYGAQLFQCQWKKNGVHAIFLLLYAIKKWGTDLESVQYIWVYLEDVFPSCLLLLLGSVLYSQTCKSLCSPLLLQVLFSRRVPEAAKRFKKPSSLFSAVLFPPHLGCLLSWFSTFWLHVFFHLGSFTLVSKVSRCLSLVRPLRAPPLSILSM